MVVQPLLLLTRNVVVQLICSKQLPSVEQVWIPESLRRCVPSYDTVVPGVHVPHPVRFAVLMGSWYFRAINIIAHADFNFYPRE